MAIEIVDFPMKNKVDLSSSLFWHNQRDNGKQTLVFVGENPSFLICKWSINELSFPQLSIQLPGQVGLAAGWPDLTEIGLPLPTENTHDSWDLMRVKSLKNWWFMIHHEMAKL